MMRLLPKARGHWKIRRQATHRRGLTMIEALTAMTVTLIFIGGVTTAFIQIIRSADQAEAMVRANSAARSATDRIANELRQIQLDANRVHRRLELVNRPLTHGNNIDTDDDGQSGEEFVDARDTDGSWTQEDDAHASIDGLRERPDFVNLPDLGDEDVDEDYRFSADEISWVVAGTDGEQRVTYRLDSFEDEDNVLVRAVEVGNNDETVEPIVFDVVSLDILAWDANAEIIDFTNFDPIVPYWVEEWDSEPIILNPDRYIPGVNPPLFPDGQPVVQVEPFYIPPSFYIRVTVNAEPRTLRDIPENEWPQGDNPLNTVSASTVINVESVIQGQLYFNYIRK